MFAYKYWTLSFRIESIFHNEESPDLKSQSRLNFWIIFNIFFWQSVSAVSYILLQTVTAPFWLLFLTYFGYWTFLVISCGTLYILQDAFQRIAKFSANEKLQVNTTMIRLHLISYVVFLFSFLLYLGAFIVNNQVIFSIFTTMVGISALVGELILVFIFNSILNGEVGKTKKSSKMA